MVIRCNVVKTQAKYKQHLLYGIPSDNVLQIIVAWRNQVVSPNKKIALKIA